MTQACTNQSKTAIEIGKTIPNPGVTRPETTTTTSKDNKDDKNSCLDGAFPFLS